MVSAAARMPYFGTPRGRGSHTASTANWRISVPGHLVLEDVPS